ncbi:MAG: ABC transporter permease [Thermoplasmata archaeon]|nr:MAG: ABC transporter permease [Thermoplasmata archaeon]
MSLNTNAIYTIAKKEFIDNARNKWIVALTIIFIFLTIASSVMAGGGKMGEMDVTVAALLSIATILIPIIAIMLGYATISGEAESGALAVVLSYPVKRIEVLFGKFLGLGAVICFSVLLGFGSAGLVISATTEHAQWVGYLKFILLTMLIGLVYLSLSICCSAVLKRRVTSLAAGIVIFFWAMIIGMVFFGLLYATGGSPEAFMMGDMEGIPDWFWVDPFLSPADGYQTASMFAFDVTEFFGYELTVPSWLNMGTIVLSQLLWLFIPLILAYYFFEKRDI